MVGLSRDRRGLNRAVVAERTLEVLWEVLKVTSLLRDESFRSLYLAGSTLAANLKSALLLLSARFLLRECSLNHLDFVLE